MALPIIAIVGEPNVGKSTLLNKIAGQRPAVTSPVAGTTRDRQYIDTSWNGVDFTLVDTAGLTFGKTGELEEELTKQIDVAVDQADLLLMVVDGKLPKENLDRKTLLRFRKSKKPVVLAINKADSPKVGESLLAEFASLGIKPSFAVSAISGRGLGDMLDYLGKYIKEHKLSVPEPKPIGIGVAIVGKPNVGKSSIFNNIIKEDRVVVSSIPGTTRTAIDTQITIDGEPYTFIDTAGLKKKEHRQALPDIYSGFQTFKALRRSDISFFVIDSIEDITKQDLHIAGEIIEMDKGVIILANKFDIFDGDEDQLRDYISHHFPFLWFAPIFFVSAVTGEGLDEALAAIKPIYEARHKLIDQDKLDQLLFRKMKVNPPKRLRDQKIPKIFGLKQLDTNPPLFELLCNYPAAISKQFRDSVKKSIMKELNFWGTPINMRLTGKDKK